MNGFTTSTAPAPPLQEARPHPRAEPVIDATTLDSVIDSAAQSLIGQQDADGSWVYELEADATIPAEYIMLEHFLGDIDPEIERKLAAYLRDVQGEHGGWPLYHLGDFNLSASVKAYLALKLAGDAPEAPHMQRAREAILAHGGAARTNVFTRISLALFRQVPWRAIPAMPPEIMLLPRWFPFHLTKVSYWSRTVIVPLLILLARKPAALNPRGVNIAELFTTAPFDERHYLVNPTGKPLGDVLLTVDRIVRMVEPLFPKSLQRRSIEKAVAWVTERLNGEDGLGGIFPAMVNTVLAFHVLGYPRDHPDFVTAREAVRKLLVFKNGYGYCQPCMSPVWDTGLALHALLEAGEPANSPVMKSAIDWLIDRQITDVRGDWAGARPDTSPGGWAFQYRNDYYPDTDDTGMVVMALQRSEDPAAKPAIERGIQWILGMQSKTGGWGSFDADNTHAYLNHIPFADHGALLDPPTADVSARCIGALCQHGMDRNHPAVARGIEFLKRDQEPDGSWFGRWGTNYIYGTWSVLCALNAAGEDPSQPYIQKAVAWLKACQSADGGWGEDCSTYWDHRRGEAKAPTPSQTAWALLGLMAAGEVDSPEVARGIRFLIDAPHADGGWQEDVYNAVGFPRVFYLKYHGYAKYFPLWALARYRTLKSGNRATTPHGM